MRRLSFLRLLRPISPHKLLDRSCVGQVSKEMEKGKQAQGTKQTPFPQQHPKKPEKLLRWKVLLMSILKN